MPRIKRRLLFLEELERLQQSPLDSGRGNSITSRSSKVNCTITGAPKSPKRANRNNTKTNRPLSVTSNTTKPFDYNKILENIDRENGQKVEEDYPYTFNTSFWHLQHPDHNDYDHFVHWAEEEVNYTTNFMVPYRFLKQPRYKKNIFKSKLDCGEFQQQQELKDFKDSGDNGFLEWYNKMQAKVTAKLQEHESLSVSFIGSG